MEHEANKQAGTIELDDGSSAFLFADFLRESRALPAGEPGTYGATPLDRVATLEQQIDLLKSLQEYTYRNIPDDVPMAIFDYVHTMFASRFHHRSEANEENYTTALIEADFFAHYPDILDMFNRAELGKANPSELLATQELRGIRSVELACLTHPYGERIDPLLDEMRTVVQAHVELLGGVYYGEPETRYRVKEIIINENGEQDFSVGLLMTRKRTLGYMPDGTIIRERSSFVLRLDEGCPVTEADIEALRSVDLTAKDWQDQLVRAGNLDEIVSELLRLDAFSLAIPLSTTIYAYNTETAQKITKREDELRKEKHAELAREFPTLAAAIEEHKDDDTIYKKVDGMLYIGPSKNE